MCVCVSMCVFIFPCCLPVCVAQYDKERENFAKGHIDRFNFQTVDFQQGALESLVLSFDAKDKAVWRLDKIELRSVNSAGVEWKGGNHAFFFSFCYCWTVSLSYLVRPCFPDIEGNIPTLSGTCRATTWAGCSFQKHQSRRKGFVVMSPPLGGDLHKSCLFCLFPQVPWSDYKPLPSLIF